MRIAVCVKQVPVVSRIRFDNETRRLVREGVPNDVNHFDLLAVAAATHLKARHRAEVDVYTMGPPQAREALVQCLAMGADHGFHLVGRAFAGSDTLATARALSMALGPRGYDLILCGRNSVDAETGQVGPEIAEMMGLPMITSVRRLDVSGADGAVRAERVTASGHDLVECSLPALVTVTEGVAEEAYPGPEAMEAARAHPIVEVTPTDLSSDTSIFGAEGSPTWVAEVRSEPSEREGIVLADLPPDDAARQVVAYLDRRGALEAGRAQRPPREARGPRRAASDGGAVWVLAELAGDEVRPVTLELLGAAGRLARRLGTAVEAVLLGREVELHAGLLSAAGADRVLVADDPGLAPFDAMAHAAVVARAISAHAPYAVLAPSTVNGRDLAARVAARLGLGLAGDCVGLDLDEEGRLVGLKPAFGGSIVAPVLSRTTPAMATVRPGILTAAEPDWSVEPVIAHLPVSGLPPTPVQVLDRVETVSAAGAGLDDARVVVTVGKGLGAPENMAVAEELADVLGAAVGATRDVVEMGWLPSHRQIGLSGRAVAPELYVAVGVRGAFNHMVGVRKAGTIVAINSNPRAPVFRAADIGVVGDYAEVVPALVAALRERFAKRRG